MTPTAADPPDGQSQSEGDDAPDPRPSTVGPRGREHAEDETPSVSDGRRSLAAVLLLLVVPWTVVQYGGGDVDFLFLWGLVNSSPWHLTDLFAYLTVYTAGFESLPPRLQAWPAGSGLYLLAVGSAALAALSDRGDPRLTAGLLALAALVHLRVTAGLSRVGEQPLPVGALLALGVAWWVYRTDTTPGSGSTDSA